jgi:hypothetical protein
VLMPHSFVALSPAGIGTSVFSPLPVAMVGPRPYHHPNYRWTKSPPSATWAEHVPVASVLRIPVRTSEKLLLTRAAS